MAKKKAKKNGGILGVVASVVLLIFSIICVAGLAAPLYTSTNALDEVTTVTAFEFMDKYNEVDEDGVKYIDSVKEARDEAKKTLDDAKADLKAAEDKGSSNTIIGIKKDLVAAKQVIFDSFNNPAVLYDTILSVEIMAIIAIVAAIIGLIFCALKKGTIAFIFNLLATLLLVGTTVAACFMTATGNAIIDADAALKIVTTFTVPALVLSVSLIGALAGGVLSFVGRKK